MPPADGTSHEKLELFLTSSELISQTGYQDDDACAFAARTGLAFLMREVTMAEISNDDLFASFAALTQLDAEHLRRGGSFMVDEVECAMLPGTHEHARDMLICQVDFGLPPAEKMADVLRSLLELNYLQASQGACFTMAPGTSHVVHVLCLPIEFLDAESLADTFEACAAQARQWRTHHFLDGNYIEDSRQRVSVMQLA
jgi:hypothetical protein